MTILPDKVLRCMAEAERAKLGKKGRTFKECEQARVAKKESELHAQIAGLLSVKGITYGHARTDRKSTYTVGWPDFAFCYRGKPFAVEVKMPGRDLDEPQEKVFSGMTRDGWIYAVVNSVEQVRNLLAQFDEPELRTALAPRVHPGLPLQDKPATK